MQAIINVVFLRLVASLLGLGESFGAGNMNRRGLVVAKSSGLVIIINNPRELHALRFTILRMRGLVTRLLRINTSLECRCMANRL